MTTAPATAVDQVPPIRGDEVGQLATTAYERLLTELRALEAPDWSRPTDCGEWDVRLLVAHLLGAAEANASKREEIRQLGRGRLAARRRGGAPLIDGINAVQVADRSHLTPAELVQRLATVAPSAVEGRLRTPALLRGLPVPDGVGGRISMGFLVDVIYTRDVWMHRVDIARATGRELRLTPDHDGRIVGHVVAEWARRHGRACTLVLTGPAGGTFVAGGGGERYELDAVEFCRGLAGRREAVGILAGPVPF